jgi:uncharacterized membrane protein
MHSAAFTIIRPGDQARRYRGPTRRAVLTACVSAGLLGCAAAPALATTYTITDLGSLGLGVSRGFGINAGAQVAGGSYLASTVPTRCPPRHKPPCTRHPEHAFAFSNGQMRDLGTLGGTDSQGQAINLSGEVTGYSHTSSGNIQGSSPRTGR